MSLSNQIFNKKNLQLDLIMNYIGLDIDNLIGCKKKRLSVQKKVKSTADLSF